MYSKQPGLTVRLLALNISNVNEAKAAYGDMAQCSTMHSLAYQELKKHGKTFKFVRSYLTVQDIPFRDVPYTIKQIMLQYFNEYCDSRFTSYSEYLENIEEVNQIAAIKTRELLNLMSKTKIPVTHAFYLKMYVLLLTENKIKAPSFDVLVSEEVQDTTTLSQIITDKIQAKLKILTGDDKQQIYRYLGCINAFALYPDATKLRLTKSFRVSTQIAQRVEAFGKKHFSKDFVFKGMEYDKEPKIVTRAYICRTNNNLIKKMIRLDKVGTPYNLSTKSKLANMFSLPLAILFTKPSTTKTQNPEYQHIQDEVNDWSAGGKKGNKLAYLMKANEGNPQVISAIKLVATYGIQIFDTYKNAKSHQNSKANLTLLSGHVSKGGTWDSVELAPDIHETLMKTILKGTPEEIESEHFLAYVCATRARYELIGCTFL